MFFIAFHSNLIRNIVEKGEAFESNRNPPVRCSGNPDLKKIFRVGINKKGLLCLNTLAHSCSLYWLFIIHMEET